MSLATKAFTVVTEFKFDIAGAVVGSEKIQNAVDGISKKADQAIQSMSSLGMSMAMQFSGAGGGILGVLGSAIKASDAFKNSQLSFANIISANMANVTGYVDTFNQRLYMSKQIMGDIAKDSAKFGLDPKALLNMTKSLSAELAPKGLAGQNFSAARTMGRNFLKSAPNLNIDPMQSQGQLLRAIEGSASMGDTLFKRLVTEAPEAFGDITKSGKSKGVSKAFNAKSLTKRFDILNKALAKFSSDTQILDARANLLSSVFTRIKSLFSGFTSILKPLGDVILPPLLKLLNYGIMMIETKGRKIVKMFSAFLGPLLEEPEKVIMKLMELRDMSKNVSNTFKIGGLIVSFMHIHELMHLITKIPILGAGLSAIAVKIPILAKLGRGLLKLGGAFKGLLGGTGGMFSTIIGTIAKVTGFLSIVFIMFSALSRSMARARIETFKWWARNANRFAEMMVRLGNIIKAILKPIDTITEGWSRIFDQVIGGTKKLDIFAAVLEYGIEVLELGVDAFTIFFGGLTAGISILYDSSLFIVDFFLTIGKLVWQLVTMDFSGAKTTGMQFIETAKGMPELMQSNSIAHYQSYQRDKVGGVDEGKPESFQNQHITQHNNITMNNDFKNQQPDRIAFTISKQIQKTANYATTVKGKTLSSGNHGASGSW